MGNDEASRFRELLAAERRSADLYGGLAEAAHGQRREILNQLAAVERRHAEHWAAKLVEVGSRCRSRGAVARVRGCCRGWRGGCPSMRYCGISSAASAAMQACTRTTPRPRRT
jgi:hypothetical protein